MTSLLPLLTPHNFLILVGFMLIVFGIKVLLLDVQKNRNDENKNPISKETVPQCNIKLFDFKINNGLVLIILGMILQMFSVSHIPSKDGVDKVEKNNTIADTNKSGIVSINTNITNSDTSTCSNQNQISQKSTKKNLHPNQGECNESKPK